MALILDCKILDEQIKIKRSGLEIVMEIQVQVIPSWFLFDLKWEPLTERFRFCLLLTLSLPQKLKNSILHIPIILQAISMNN